MYCVRCCPCDLTQLNDIPTVTSLQTPRDFQLNSGNVLDAEKPAVGDIVLSKVLPSAMESECDQEKRKI